MTSSSDNLQSGDGASGGAAVVIEPGIRRLLDDLAASPQMPITPASIAASRAVPGLMEILFGPGPDIHSVEDRMVGSGGHRVPVRIYRPSPDTPGWVVFLHGGGWVRGSAAGYDAFARILAHRTGFQVVSIDYRLAPEHLFPAALDDCMAVIAWADGALRRPASSWRKPLVLLGESAGGNIVAAAAILSAGRGLAVAGQVLAYPVTDHDFETPSYRDFATGMILTRDAMMRFWDLYAGDADRNDFRLSPLRASCVANVAPAMILTAGLDPLRDEGEAYGWKLRRAGVDAVIRRYDGLPHGFLAMHRISETARAANEEIYQRIRATVAS